MNQPSERTSWLLTRAGHGLLTIWGASMVVFAVLPLTGDPVDAYIHLRAGFNPTPAQIVQVRHQLGLDRSLVAQYLSWLWHALHWDFGISFRTGQPVGAELASRLAATAVLAGVALAAALVASLVLGLVCGAWAGKWPDDAVRVFSSVGVAVPDFVVGLVLLIVVVVDFGIGQVVSDGALAHVALPAAALALAATARWAQILRIGLLDALASRYALVAAARGASRTRILLHHALPNALPAYLTSVGVEMGFLLGGTAVIEAVFSWPGVGQWLVTAVRARDLPDIEAFALLAATGFVVLSLTVDLAVGWLDPRTQRTGR
ncbi:MAG: ABC transporter permease [Pseudonocardiaceae bacterium]